MIHLTPSCKINIRVQHHPSPDSPRPIPIHSVPLEDELRIPGRLEYHLHEYGISSLLSTKVTPLKHGSVLPSFFLFSINLHTMCPLLVWVARSIYLGHQNRAIVYKVRPNVCQAQPIPMPSSHLTVLAATASRSPLSPIFRLPICDTTTNCIRTWRTITYQQFFHDVEKSAKYWAHLFADQGIPQRSVIGLW